MVHSRGADRPQPCAHQIHWIPFRTSAKRFSAATAAEPWYNSLLICCRVMSYTDDKDHFTAVPKCRLIRAFSDFMYLVLIPSWRMVFREKSLNSDDEELPALLWNVTMGLSTVFQVTSTSLGHGSQGVEGSCTVSSAACATRSWSLRPRQIVTHPSW